MIVGQILRASVLLSPFKRQLGCGFTSPTQTLDPISTSIYNELRMSSSESTDSDAGIIALNVKMVVKPEHKESLLKVLEADAKGSRNTEPGCLQFLVGTDVDDPNTLFLHEQYKSQADFDVHGATPHLQAVFDFLKDHDPLIEPMVGQIYKCHHDPVKIDNSQFSAFCLNVEACVKPELRDDFIELMTSHQQNSKAEPLCRQFDWGVSVEDPNSFHMHEEYKGKQGFDAHERSQHFAKFIQFIEEKQPCTKPPVVQFYNTLPF
ncbi:antibiotic biosynthesis monooxygenase [Nitzschia inconspicua]|uniref:Antibiotic biosynthesis monooxygenase n=1 Tax=Nitzschia inconspicua TaxID=303405 RepID=A0A9K3Q7C4_9STRA|nr:antibiotic biosynthesis monooxygenase [Nitzschia inconspicua]